MTVAVFGNRHVFSWSSGKLEHKLLSSRMAIASLSFSGSTAPASDEAEYDRTMSDASKKLRRYVQDTKARPSSTRFRAQTPKNSLMGTIWEQTTTIISNTTSTTSISRISDYRQDQA